MTCSSSHMASIRTGRTAAASARCAALLSVFSVGLLCTLTTSTKADVIGRTLLFNTLDATAQLRKVAAPRPINDWRYYTVKGFNAEGYINPAFDDYGFLSTGADLLIIPLQSGGSGGVFSALLFTSLMHEPKFIGVVPSPNGHLTVSISEGNIEVSTPNYGPGDPNCCPSSRTYLTYALDGIRLHKIAERTVGFAK